MADRKTFGHLSQRVATRRQSFNLRQMASTIDEYVYDGSDELIAGDVEAGETFTEGDFNTRIIIEERELSRVKEFMSQIDQRQKTLVFCATQNHAALVRDLINQVKDSSHPNYCHRVTADDGAVGEQHLRDFQDNAKTIPTVLTTSQKLSTGVDARNVRNIVLMRPIRSMIEFKQIIGRGTRVYEGKDFFTIWDFVQAHENFNDPEWDGDPIDPPPPIKGPSTPPPKPPDPPTGPEGGVKEEPKEKIRIKLADGKTRTIRFIATTTYWSAAVGAKTAYIEPGSPWENGYVESFNARFRDELLNGELFYTLREAQILIEQWRIHYNTVRPHSALGYRPPAPESIVPMDQRPTMH